MTDKYTSATLRTFWNLHKNYVQALQETARTTGVDIRLPTMPEHISENLIKFIIHKNGDHTSTWNCDVGDLVSAREGKQECKCFTSDGPPSFTPSSEWDVIYFLDARNWLTDHIVLWRVGLKKSDPQWRAIKVSRTQTFGDQASSGRRPRITWKALYPQISEFCTKIYDGPFEGVFTRSEVGPVAERSVEQPEQIPRSPPVCTDVNRPGPEACTSEGTPEN
jgi:hypothetical protein